eukprot:431195-Ditylum_brightwellii.AAC.1
MGKVLAECGRKKDRVVFGRVQTEGFVHLLLCKNHWSWIFCLKVDTQLNKEEQDDIITIYENNNTEHHDHNKKWPWTHSLPDHMSIKYDGEGIFEISQFGKGSDCPSEEDFQSVHTAQYNLLLQDGNDNAKNWKSKIEDMNSCLNGWKNACNSNNTTALCQNYRDQQSYESRTKSYKKRKTIANNQDLQKEIKQNAIKWLKIFGVPTEMNGQVRLTEEATNKKLKLRQSWQLTYGKAV